MNSFAQFCKRISQRKRRSYCVLSAVLCTFLLTAAPALAEPVTVRQVVQTLSSSQGNPDLKLSALISQDPAKGTQQSGSTTAQAPAKGTGKVESIISGVTVTSEGQQIGVDIIEEGEVEGTICDCGEIIIAGGAFPKWPFFFLGAVPLAFINGNDCETCNETPSSTPTPTPPSTPTPTPPPPAVPEPASLFLFGTGVAAFGAGIRRRYARAKLASRREE